MLKTLKRDKKLRVNFNKKELIGLIFKFLNLSNFLCIFNNQFYLYILKFYSKISINNFCIISSKTRNIFSKFKISRIILKQFLKFKVFSNLKKN
jgi:hypothetical protein